jgi:hypothetical protein
MLMIAIFLAGRRHDCYGAKTTMLADVSGAWRSSGDQRADHIREGRRILYRDV